MEWQVKLLKVVRQCSFQFVSGSIVRVPVSVRALLRQTRCSDDLFLAQIVTLFSRFVRVQLFYTRLGTHLFVALNDHWIEETNSFKTSQDFLRQILVTTFPSAHEADHHSTARFHECDTWLSFALCHCSNEHVVCLEFRQCIRCLVHHNSSVRRTSSTTRNTDRTPISEWNMCRVVCHSRSICRRFRST